MRAVHIVHYEVVIYLRPYPYMYIHGTNVWVILHMYIGSYNGAILMKKTKLRIFDVLVFFLQMVFQSKIS